MLLSYGAAGIYATPNILLSAKTLFNQNILQQDVVLHEYTHHFDLNSESLKSFKPNHARIGIEKLPLEARARYQIYKRGFSLDEIKGNRMSLRVMTHEMLSNGSAANRAEMERLQFYLRFQIDFSELAKKVYSKMLEDPNSVTEVSLDKLHVTFSKEEIYSIAKYNVSQNKEILKFAEYNFELYTMLSQKLKKVMLESIKNRESFIIKLNKILSMREIRNSEEYYLPLEQIQEILEN